MIQFVLNKNKKSLILFVHGFTGDESTWTYSDKVSFASLLALQSEITNLYDIAYFSYFTRLTNFSTKAGFFKKLFRGRGEYKHNISVHEIGSLLRSEIRFQLSAYDNIVVIAHSMGGLVTKSCILQEMQESRLSKIRLFISLAVPHSGSNLALLGNLISSNVQLGDLTPLNTFIHDLNDSWLKATNRPTTKYLYGTFDKIVSKTSACPPDKDQSDEIALEADHTSISKPKSFQDTIFLAITSIISEWGQSDPAIGAIPFQKLVNETSYEDELFVIKLLIADIHHASIKNAKEQFLNAEYARKLFSNESDKTRLSDLYTRIKTIYTNHYTSYVHGGINNSGQLLAEVNKNITSEDITFLKCHLMPSLNAIHKQGMLQQLANSVDEDVFWTKDQGIEAQKNKLGEA